MNPSAKEHLLERLISTVGRIHDAATALDKTLLSLSGGALVFSMTFVDRLAPLRLCLPLLFLAWALFGASMVSIVFGMRVAHNYLVRQAKEIVDLWNQLNTAESGGWTAQISFEVSRTRAKWLNRVAIGTFLLGFVTLAIFVAINLLNGCRPIA